MGELAALLGPRKFFLEFARTLLHLTGQPTIDTSESEGSTESRFSIPIGDYKSCSSNSRPSNRLIDSKQPEQPCLSLKARIFSYDRRPPLSPVVPSNFSRSAEKLGQASILGAPLGVGQFLTLKGNLRKILYGEQTSKSVQSESKVSECDEDHFSLDVASELVEMMNWVLLTSIETRTLRNDLQNGKL